MKKLILSLVILVMAASLTAQVSVWDGSYEEFDASNEKGLTEDNPILIENAAQLAFMSQQFYSANNKKYYKLTTDIDLNYLPWIAIGLLGNSTFYGYFDGGTLIKLYPVRPWGGVWDKVKRKPMSLSVFEVKREE
jgi:hypothetical protein